MSEQATILSFAGIIQDFFKSDKSQMEIYLQSGNMIVIYKSDKLEFMKGQVVKFSSPNRLKFISLRMIEEIEWW